MRFLITLILVLIVGGCASHKATAKADKALGDAGKSTARIEVRSEVITAQAKLLPKSEPRETIIEQAGGVKADAVEAQSELDKAQVNMHLMAGTINNQTTEIAVLKSQVDALNRRWIGPRLVRVFGWIVAGVAVAGVVSVALGVASPTGWGLFLSRIINANIMLPFMWLRDLLLRLRGVRVGAVEKQ